MGVILGLIISLMIPPFIAKFMKARRDRKFAAQLVDGLMILSSSLRGGLSFLQSLEVLQEEMPSPISEEFGLVVRETKMGVSIDEALENLNKRMPSEELELFISSVLVARETGGDLTKVFARLISTIRERTKLKEAIATYTLQGKIQGIIMSILPIVFVLWVRKFNPEHFDIMLQSNAGRALLVVAVFLEIIALFLIKKFSTIKV
jgi:tight adherence protein B